MASWFFGRARRRLDDTADSTLGKTSTAEEVAQLYGKDLKDKTVVITGANTGIGLETAKVFAKFGSKVVLCCRSETSGSAAVQSIAEETGGDVSLQIMDLNDLRSVETAAVELNKLERLDYLVLNAGIMATPRGYTAQGFEQQIGVNHMAHFYLTDRLLGRIKALATSQPVRIVVLASIAHQLGTLDLDDLHFKNGRRYTPWSAYGQSKLANLFFARGLAKRFQGTNVSAFSVHPGVIATTLWHRSFWNRLLSNFVSDKDIPQGAATTVYACLAPQLERFSGSYLSDCDVAEPSRSAYDPTGEKRDKLWEVTEEQLKEALHSGGR